MKILFNEFLFLFNKRQERSIRILRKFLLLLLVLVCLYTVLFHFVMLHEDRQFSWITGLYWTLTVMSTLGFGDITFSTDLGKVFSIVVLLSGIIFLLTMLPFVFIQFIYLPWLESQRASIAPRELPATTERHVILTGYDPICVNLMELLKQYRYDHVLIEPDIRKAVELHDLGYPVLVGEPDDPATYRSGRVEKAALVFANIDDMVNTNIAFTVREITREIPIVASADLDDSVNILELAGSSHVFQFKKMLGHSMARRVLGTSTKANVIGNIDSLLIAEASAMKTSLEGKNLEQAELRQRFGITVVGVWERGRLHMPRAETVITPSSLLLLAGSAEQLRDYDEHFSRDRDPVTRVLILGGGRVGCAAAQILDERGIDYRIIEKKPALVKDEHYVQGSAADINTLKTAGIGLAQAVLVTTHDDPTNIYLSIYCRKLRPDIRIISRANHDRNVAQLHSAGADLVLSYGSMAANMIVNLLMPGEHLMIAEGLYVFRVDVHSSLVGKRLNESLIRRDTGCNVIAVNNKGDMIANPDPSFRFAKGHELILIGTHDAERRFFASYSEKS
ncbi:MAG: NAD-binding protein [Desulfomonilaceae bacterium]|nr:NAD-binding protein [Desulfomonilaceae bacterium]